MTLDQWRLQGGRVYSRRMQPYVSDCGSSLGNHAGGNRRNLRHAHGFLQPQRRQKVGAGVTVIEFGSIRVDRTHRSVTRDGVAIHLTPHRIPTAWRAADQCLPRSDPPPVVDGYMRIRVRRTRLLSTHPA